jgi:hypothetical protein
METLQKIACLRQLLGKVGVGLDDKYLVPQAVKFLQEYQDTMADKAFTRSGDSTALSNCLIDDLYINYDYLYLDSSERKSYPNPT